ncbi:MAG: sugar phosphate isomerase/epimerase [bacterium]|nr:sugar phosphate isomerase/epimerase [bacterium]
MTEGSSSLGAEDDRFAWQSRPGWTRRRFMGEGLCWVCAVTLPAASIAREAGADPFDFGPFSMGIQSFTLRRLALEPMLDVVAELGLCCVEAIPQTKIWFYEFGNHVPITHDRDEIRRTQELFRARGLRLAASGVHAIDDATTAEQLFAFASAAEIPVLTIDPAPEALDACDRLCASHPEVRLAIHNHGPWMRYDKIDDVVRALEGRHPGFGACVDTGHFIRSGEDPVDAVRRLGARVHAVHLKDVAGPGLMPEARVLGEGGLDLDGFFSALLEVGFGPRDPLSLEYEEDPEDPVPAIRASLSAAASAIGRVAPP